MGQDHGDDGGYPISLLMCDGDVGSKEGPRPSDMSAYMSGSQMLVDGGAFVNLQ